MGNCCCAALYDNLLTYGLVFLLAVVGSIWAVGLSRRGAPVSERRGKARTR